MRLAGIGARAVAVAGWMTVFIVCAKTIFFDTCDDRRTGANKIRTLDYAIKVQVAIARRAAAIASIVAANLVALGPNAFAFGPGTVAVDNARVSERNAFWSTAACSIAVGLAGRTRVVLAFIVKVEFI